jgi:hypothetical protein
MSQGPTFTEAEKVMALHRTVRYAVLSKLKTMDLPPWIKPEEMAEEIATEFILAVNEVARDL